MLRTNKNNFIVLDVINFKKNLFMFYKKNLTSFMFESFYFFNYNKKNYLVVYFNHYNYFSIKKKVFCFLKDEDVIFEVMFIRYKNNLYSLPFFEKIFLNSQDFYEDFFFYLHLITVRRLCDFGFFSFYFVFLLNNLIKILKCQLYTKPRLK